ncbi:Gfo/Idh/MocA family protein [Portibacter marinus]|uniref:Gfo/Idh/MocA family protein n=1 Tax=Portibacter marinus TaxID=2898660 RepID=UPI001F2F76D7|nr:Gfo/Idh/MocA family oxidoreductase [Portibacter marinus]
MSGFNINRRHFLKSSAAISAISALGWRGFDLIKSLETLQVGVIGTGWYGKNDVLRLIQVADVNVKAIAEVDAKMAEGAAEIISQRQKSGKKPTVFSDYRKMLEREDFDIVIIGTPDHWHALTAIDAIQSGAHVYLQKPISVDVLEGEAILKAAREHNKTVQIGTQRRSTPHLVEAKQKIVDEGLLGKVAHIEICSYYHMRFNGDPPVQPVPEHFDYDFWCGPAPVRPFDGLPHRRWRAYMEYGNGIVGDMCVHMLDTVRWMLGLGWPEQISSTGGIFVQKESNANITDTQTAVFEYDEMNVVWTHRTWGRPADPDYPWAFKIYGEHGLLKGDVFKYEFVGNDKTVVRGEVWLEKDLYPEDVGEKDLEIHAAPATRRHMLDFLSAIEKGSRPVADIEEGLISSASCILANVALDVGRPVSYDHEARMIHGDEESTKLLARKYREGFTHPSKRL